MQGMGRIGNACPDRLEKHWEVGLPDKTRSTQISVRPEYFTGILTLRLICCLLGTHISLGFLWLVLICYIWFPYQRVSGSWSVTRWKEGRIAQRTERSSMEKVTSGRSWLGGGAGQCLQGQVCSPVDHPAGHVHQAGVTLRGGSGWRWSLGTASRQVTLAMAKDLRKAKVKEETGHGVNTGSTDA